ncbi:MAG: hypothetical protein LQ342_001280 [Letrouitia transgressa]|nr:MAG: hypothetical protein LQ342_001280 [Letrouitia transgressa]
MNENKKRKSESNVESRAIKKIKRKWQVPRQKHPEAIAIEPGDAGIWATCDMHKEGKCTVELKDLFNEYAVEIYGNSITGNDPSSSDEEDEEADVEAEIQREVQGIKNMKAKSLFQPIKIDIQCVLFFKTRDPIEPVTFVQRLCSDALSNKVLRKSRFVKRLTPMSQMGKATEKSLGEVARAVLAPTFHGPDIPPKKFAIQPTFRNHSVMKRDDVIRQIASLVGKPHTVDLKSYDCLILVYIYRNICGMSVVGPDYEKLKRFNLAEIHGPTPRPGA